MSASERFPNPPTVPGGADGDLDGLLSAFFRSELPAAWPEFRVPADPPRPGLLRPSSLGFSRLVLAAAAALLLLGYLGAARMFRPVDNVSLGRPTYLEAAKPNFTSKRDPDRLDRSPIDANGTQPGRARE